MSFRLPLWGFKTPDPPPRPDTSQMEEQVRLMVEAHVDMLRARYKAREAFLRGQAAAADSRVVREVLVAQADGVVWCASQLGGEES